MKKAVFAVLLLFLFFTVAGCSNGDIVGVWEAEMEISVLGLDKADSAASVLRFTFFEDGTGSQEQIIIDGTYPDIIRTFRYELDGSTLTLNYEDLQTEVFSIMFDSTSLQMDSNRINYQLMKVQE